MRHSFVLAMRDYFLAREGEWIDSRQLEIVGGRMAWRTRVSDVRRKYQMAIENRQYPATVGGQTFTVSEYRYSPADEFRLTA